MINFILLRLCLHVKIIIPQYTKLAVVSLDEYNWYSRICSCDSR